MYELRYLNFFNDCGDQELISYCLELELNFRVWDKKTVAEYAGRKILEKMTTVLKWDGDGLSNKIEKHANEENKDKLLRLARFGSVISHTKEYYSNKKIQKVFFDEQTSKHEIFKDLCYYAGREYSQKRGLEFKLSKVEDIDTERLPFYNEELGIMASVADEDSIRLGNDNDFEYFIIREDGKTKYIIRRLFGATLSRERDVANNIRGGDLVSKCIVSEGLRFDSEEQIRVLTLAPNQQTLEDFISRNHQLDPKTAFILFYDLIHIIRRLGNIVLLDKTVSICHRNLNPQTVIIQTNSENHMIILSCFEHAKISIEQIGSDTVLPRHLEALSFGKNSYFSPNIRERINPNGNETLTLGQSRYADIYAAVKILLFMITGKHNSNIEETLSKINKNDISTSFKDVIRSCFQYGSVKESSQYAEEFYNKVEQEYFRLKGVDPEKRNKLNSVENKPKKTKKAKTKDTVQVDQDKIHKIEQERDAAIKSNEETKIQIEELKRNNSSLKISLGVAIGISVLILIILLFILLK